MVQKGICSARERLYAYVNARGNDRRRRRANQVVEPTASQKESRLAVQREFLRGDYYRQFRIPKGFVTDEVDAALKSGVVTISLPREEKNKPTRIAIRIEGETETRKVIEQAD